MLKIRMVSRRGNEMKQLTEKVLFFIFTLLIFRVLWEITGFLWNAFVPWNYKTDLLALFVVIPLLFVASLSLTHLSFNIIKGDRR